MNALSMFHFLRPVWLIALIPLAFACIYWWRFYRHEHRWQEVCDPHLLPHLLVDTGTRQSRWPIALMALGGVLAIVALAGPTWKKLPEPVYRQQAARVIVLDLSKSMDATDITPSRLIRAKYKVQDILKQSREGQTALLVFAAEPYAVTPLSDDSATIAALLPPLSTQLMPSQGSRLDLALIKADELLRQAGMRNGEVVVVTDGTESLGATEKSAATLRNHGHRLAVLAVGSSTGAPIPSSQGGFVTDEQGNTIIASLDITSLKHIAKAGGGSFQRLSNDDSDIAALLNGASRISTANDTRQVRTTDRWREEGPWLLLILLPLAALAFRRGWMAASLLLIITATPSPSYALSSEDLWARQDQQAAKAFKRGDAKTAAKLFNDPAWQGSAHYRAGNYRDAAKAFARIDNANAHYNRGNALARAGQLKEALEAYSAALKKDPQHSDAQFNRALVNKLLQQQNNQNKQQASDTSAAANGTPNDSTNSSPNNATQTSAPPSPSSAEPGDTHRSQNQSSNGAQTTNDTDKPINQTQAAPAPSADQSSQQPVPQRGDEAANIAKATQDLESRQALEQWLRRIPDDPGGLMRRKFILEHQRRAGEKKVSKTPW